MKFQSIQKIVDVAKVLSDPTRVKILFVLHTQKEMCVTEISEAVGASQSATSHQLSKLEGQGIVECFRDGQLMCYELTKTPEATKIISTLLTVTTN